MHGPSVSLFCAATAALEEIHGGKLISHDIVNQMIAKLGEVQELYQALPDDPNWKPKPDVEGEEEDE